ncbi:6-phospho-3-hexuloisomerase [Alkalibacillus aidingensis]|uniref:6-phospho-3-hexuloisomerase n=1 Tax=Alkalibacillus aidingensis TaxID=2747607 RepID=UPI00166189D9|nr:6-phospho-3-hexuloisomerase [Alkalibacillus aidingensis]
MKTTLQTITSEISQIIDKVDANQVEQLAKKIATSNRIFIAGTGRSGLAGKMFAMRLMHIGYQAYVVGETITPSIEEEDLFIAISGSGETKTLAHFTQKAQEIDASIGLITTNPDSTIGKLSDEVVEIPAATKKTIGERQTIQPLGSQFDQSAHLLLDGVIVYLLEHYVEEADTASLNKKHANLE